MMPTDDEIRNKKLQYHINKEAAKISTFSSFSYLTGKEILYSDQRRMTR